MGRTVIVTGTGNNGSQPWHAGGILQQGKTEEIQLAVGAFEPTLNVQLWKDYEDEMEIYLKVRLENRLAHYMNGWAPSGICWKIQSF